MPVQNIRKGHLDTWIGELLVFGFKLDDPDTYINRHTMMQATCPKGHVFWNNRQSWGQCSWRKRNLNWCTNVECRKRAVRGGTRRHRPHRDKPYEWRLHRHQLIAAQHGFNLDFTPTTKKWRSECMVCGGVTYKNVPPKAPYPPCAVCDAKWIPVCAAIDEPPYDHALVFFGNVPPILKRDGIVTTQLAYGGDDFLSLEQQKYFQKPTAESAKHLTIIAIDHLTGRLGDRFSGDERLYPLNILHNESFTGWDRYDKGVPTYDFDVNVESPIYRALMEGA